MNTFLNRIEHPALRSTISSSKNEKIKKIIKFQKRIGRDRSDYIVIDSSREIARALENKVIIDELYYCPELIRNEETLQLFNKLSKSIPFVFELDLDVFTKICYKNNPDGLLITGKFSAKALSSIDFKKDNIILIIDGIEKPGNLGALLRTADGAGVDYIVSVNSVVNYRNPNVIRASTGVIFKGNFIETTESELIKYLKLNNYRIITATPHANNLYHQIDYKGKIAMIVGSEAFGVSKSLEKESDISVVIPMKGYADSLNVHQSATIVLYEALKQRSGF
ncbi:MAG: RNA methyltransferase [Candidatus Delongbacteria bacterium]|nr:RNA methyltransferase [Candidatus Delongbacteria bacterium]MBN2836523.1 RNA methyltransferase [Candidatus Delongbacteria bacterium]